MSDVFYEMSKVTIKPVVNYTVLQIFLISSLNFTLVVAFCTVASNDVIVLLYTLLSLTSLFMLKPSTRKFH